MAMTCVLGQCSSTSTDPEQNQSALVPQQAPNVRHASLKAASGADLGTVIRVREFQNGEVMEQAAADKTTGIST